MSMTVLNKNKNNFSSSFHFYEIMRKKTKANFCRLQVNCIDGKGWRCWWWLMIKLVVMNLSFEPIGKKSFAWLSIWWVGHILLEKSSYISWWIVITSNVNPLCSRALSCRTTNLLGITPNNLGEMTGFRWISWPTVLIQGYFIVPIHDGILTGWNWSFPPIQIFTIT